jgi:GxxExxY protein
MTLRIPSSLPDHIESLITKVIGAAIEVHRCLGPGLSEGLYEDAFAIELEALGIAFERQRAVVLEYRGQALRAQRIDLIIEEQIVIEIKAVDRLHPVHRAQLISYLRATRLPIGLLLNFDEAVLCVKRVIA